MSPKKTVRDARAMQKFSRSAKPGSPTPRPLPSREWLASLGGSFREVSGEDFDGEDLISAQLGQLHFVRCNFVGADLRQATLVGSHFSRCDFTNADLRGADLGEAGFRECDLSGARLGDAITASTRFERCRGVPARFDGQQTE